MAAYEVVESIPGLLAAATARNDDDFYDRLSSRYTVGQLILFALIVTAAQIIDDPVTCWVPAYYHGSWEGYTKSYCWIRNTYYLPWHEEVPLAPEHPESSLENYRGDGGPERGAVTVTYYQWVPIFLALQAFMFYIPCMLWRNLNHKTGIDVNMIIETAENVKEETEEPERRKRLSYLANLTRRFLGYSKKPEMAAGWCKDCNFSISLTQACCCGRKQGNYMSSLYIFMKFLSVCNVVVQYFILAAFLGDADFYSYGFRMFKAMVSGIDWTQLASFPRVTFCDIVTRRLGNDHRYTVQCVLYMNLINEKIFFYLWWWFLFLFIMSLFSFLRQAGTFCMRGRRYNYIKRHLQVYDAHIGQSESSRMCLQGFVHDFLRQDGHLVMRLIDLNTNKLTVESLLGVMWDQFLEDPKVQQRFNLKEDFPDDDSDGDTVPNQNGIEPKLNKA